MLFYRLILKTQNKLITFIILLSCKYCSLQKLIGYRYSPPTVSNVLPSMLKNTAGIRFKYSSIPFPHSQNHAPLYLASYLDQDQILHFSKDSHNLNFKTGSHWWIKSITTYNDKNRFLKRLFRSKGGKGYDKGKKMFYCF